MGTVFLLMALLVGSLVLIFLLVYYGKDTPINPDGFRDHCPYCGAELYPGQQICECGHQLDPWMNS